MVNLNNLLTTAQVAGILGVTQTRVRALITAGRLPSLQLGRDHLIKPSDVDLVKDRRPGRPKKIDTKPTKKAGGRKK